MKKYLKIILLISLTSFCLFTTKVFAINMNSIEDNNTRRNTVNTTLGDEDFEEDEDYLQTSNEHVQVSSTQNEKTSLSFEGYASVILIAIGIVLIFLAIAILIRFK